MSRGTGSRKGEAMTRAPLLVTATFLLAACSQSPSDRAADQLENAAAQSDPAAAATLENAAEAIRERDEPASAAGDAQDALQAAGNAQIGQPDPLPPGGTD